MTSNDSQHHHRRKVCVVLVDRANYGRMKPVIHSIKGNKQLELQIVVAGTMVLDRFQKSSNIVKADGFTIDSEVYMELEGSRPITMAKSIGYGIIEFSTEFHRLQPDVVVLIGDRYEALSAAIAAAYLGICIVHLQGGEVSGALDESARHSISKFAHFHYPATLRSAHFLRKMGERPDTILGTGCPSSDIAKALSKGLDPSVINGHGSGCFIDPEKPFLLVVFHPNTTDFGSEISQIQNLLSALADICMPTLLLWPNIDAGSDRISKEIRKFRDHESRPWLRTIINISPEDYLRTLRQCACAVGNSSSFVRDAGYFGTPVVLVGDRQDGREWDTHVKRVEPISSDIANTIRAQLASGRAAPSTLYGDGAVAERISHAITQLVPYKQKKLHYIHER